MSVLNPARTAEPRRDPFLIGIVIGIVVLLVAAAASVIFMRPQQQEFPAGSPSATVQRFCQAIEKQDYDLAYSLLSDSMHDKPSRDRFVNSNLQSSTRSHQTRSLRIESEQIYTNVATVTVRVEYYYAPSGPFEGSSGYSNTDSFDLQRENGEWRITDLPYPYSVY